TGAKKQSFAVPPPHAPPAQVAPTRQRSSLVQGAPSPMAAVVHAALASSQTTSWQAGGSIPQSFGGPPVHWPAWQVSAVVQKRPSSQATPSSSGTTTQVSTGPG